MADVSRPKNPYISVDGPPDVDVENERHRLYRLEREYKACRPTAKGLRRQLRIREMMQDSIWRLDAVGAVIPAEFRSGSHHSQGYGQ